MLPPIRAPRSAVLGYLVVVMVTGLAAVAWLWVRLIAFVVDARAAGVF